MTQQVGRFYNVKVPFILFKKSKYDAEKDRKSTYSSGIISTRNTLLATIKYCPVNPKFTLLQYSKVSFTEVIAELNPTGNKGVPSGIGWPLTLTVPYIRLNPCFIPCKTEIS